MARSSSFMSCSPFCYRFDDREEHYQRTIRLSKREQVRDVASGLRLLQQSVDAFDEAVARRLGLNRTDLRCLDLVLADGPLSAGDLATGLGLSPAATTTVIDRMADAGYVTRSPDPGNRRRVLVAATDAARAADRELYGPVGAAGRRALNRYDDEQLDTILDFLRTARRVQQHHVARLAAEPGRGARRSPPGERRGRASRLGP
jgi:DNA-binding MarR family transcriptional regulator